MLEMYNELALDYTYAYDEHFNKKLIIQKAYDDYDEDMWRLNYDGIEHDDIIVSPEELFAIGKFHEDAVDFVTIGDLLANESMECALAVVLAEKGVVSYDEVNAFLSYNEEDFESAPVLNPLKGWSITPFNFEEYI